MIGLLFLLIFGGYSEKTNYLFAGDGVITYAHTVLHDRVIETNCTTNNDCYDLLCAYLYQPIYLIEIVPNVWSGNCNQLDEDNRSLSAGLDIYDNNHNHQTYYTNTVSSMSKLLCTIKKKKNQIKIYYFGIDCAEKIYC